MQVTQKTQKTQETQEIIQSPFEAKDLNLQIFRWAVLEAERPTNVVFSCMRTSKLLLSVAEKLLQDREVQQAFVRRLENLMKISCLPWAGEHREIFFISLTLNFLKSKGVNFQPKDTKDLDRLSNSHKEHIESFRIWLLENMIEPCRNNSCLQVLQDALTKPILSGVTFAEFMLFLVYIFDLKVAKSLRNFVHAVLIRVIKGIENLYTFILIEKINEKVKNQSKPVRSLTKEDDIPLEISLLKDIITVVGNDIVSRKSKDELKSCYCGLVLNFLSKFDSYKTDMVLVRKFIQLFLKEDNNMMEAAYGLFKKLFARESRFFFEIKRPEVQGPFLVKAVSEETYNPSFDDIYCLFNEVEAVDFFKDNSKDFFEVVTIMIRKIEQGVQRQRAIEQLEVFFEKVKKEPFHNVDYGSVIDGFLRGLKSEYSEMKK